MASRDITQLPDRFTGELNDIRDKKIAEANDASSASDITSQCKFLLENGQTGEFMNVLKSYIDESVRSALGPLLNNLDKGTGLKAVAGIDSNNDLGTATLSNLASMLSDTALQRPLIDGLDLDNYVTNMDWTECARCANQPSTYGSIKVIRGGNYVFQIYLSRESLDKMIYERSMNHRNSMPTWTSWK